MKKKSKKTVSSEDFLNLLDDQENLKERAAFKPKNQKKSFSKIQLSPVQKELIQFAYKNSPKFVKQVVDSPRTKKWIERLEVSYFQAYKKIELLRK